MKRLTSEAGYATVAVTALAAGLSIIALSVMGLASQKSNQSEQLIEQIQMDAALEGTLNQAAFDVLNQSIDLEAALEGYEENFGNHLFKVRLEFEGEKINLNHTPLDEIEAYLRDQQSRTLSTRALSQRIKRLRARGDRKIDSLDALLSSDVPENVINCLRDKLTVFHNSRSVVRRHEGQAFSPEGTYVRFVVEDTSTRRQLDSILLFTGLASDPAWAMSWRKSYDTSEGIC